MRREQKSGRGLPHSKTFGIPCVWGGGTSWSAAVLCRFRDLMAIRTKPGSRKSLS